MMDWTEQFRASLKDAGAIADRFSLNPRSIETVTRIFPARITPYYADLIARFGQPLFRQLIPDPAELDDRDGRIDPLAEEADAPVSSIIHRYPDRALLIVTHLCASYCRFCTRKRRVGRRIGWDARAVSEGLDYIRRHPAIRDVIVSGGDPLILSDRRLAWILTSLRAIRHVEIIRIGTRVPCFLPHRVTEELAALLKRFHPLFINVHFNHPDEITPESAAALARLADAGIPLGNQTVLLKGVNDDPEVMKRLLTGLLRVRVRPYYIYQADVVQGTAHLRTRVERGIEIMDALRGWISGLAVPQYVIDAPGGGGKIPLLPEYLLRLDQGEAVLRNYAGEIFRYPQIEKGGAGVPGNIRGNRGSAPDPRIPTAA
jgi:lysine 2,3-aminomutase